MKNIVKEEHYRNMIMLLEFFQYYTDGLSQKHFRYMLMKHPRLDTSTSKKMEKFFDQDYKPIREWFENDGSKKGCVSTQKNLNYYLKVLHEKKIIEKTNRKKPFKYRLTTEFYRQYEKLKIMEYINRWDYTDKMTNLLPLRWVCPQCGEENFESFKDNCKKCKNPRNSTKFTRFEEWQLFGISGLQFEEDEYEEIGRCMKNIEDALWKIVKLKSTKSLEEPGGKNSIDFFYHGSKI